MMTSQKLFVEFIGSAMLSGVVIGSGILALALADGNAAVALLGNTIATGAVLWVIVATMAPISGAHFNPAVTLAFLLRGQINLPLAVGFILVQVIGCLAGALLAHGMFELPLLQMATTERAGSGKILSEAVATFMLVFAIFGALRHAPRAVPTAVALIIVAGYWWTASTSFANPAITIARSISDTFAGVRPQDVPGFLAGQLTGAILATFVARLIFWSEKDKI